VDVALLITTAIVAYWLGFRQGRITIRRAIKRKIEELS
jgi:hypothetical protein